MSLRTLQKNIFKDMISDKVPKITAPCFSTILEPEGAEDLLAALKVENSSVQLCRAV